MHQQISATRIPKQQNKYFFSSLSSPSRIRLRSDA
jgi:hypothetical protein